MNKSELIDSISSCLFRKAGKLESRRSWLAMRNYLKQLDIEQLKDLYDESI